MQPPDKLHHLVPHHRATLVHVAIWVADLLDVAAEFKPIEDDLICPPLKWSSLKYGFDHGGEEDWLGSGIVLKRQLGSYGRLPSAECLALEAYLGYFYLAETTNQILSSLFGKHELVRLLYQSIQL